MKKVFAMALVFMVVLSLGIPAFASGDSLTLEQAKQAAMVTAHMEGAIIYTEMALEAFTSLFAEIQAKCISHDNTLESDLLLDGVPQETVNAIMRKQRDRTNAMLTEFADGGQSTLTQPVEGKPKRRYIKSEKGVSSTAAGNRKRVGRPQ